MRNCRRSVQAIPGLIEGIDMRALKECALAGAVAATVLASASALADNGAPSGAHYNLNIIGVENPKSADMKGSKGRRMFVPLHGTTTITLTSAPTFRMYDANGTDGRAEFALPNTDPNHDGFTDYAVYARTLGSPGGDSTTNACALDDATAETFCSTYSMVSTRNDQGGKSTFTDVTPELLYVYADFDQNGVIERYPLFSDATLGYYWTYDNKGRKVAQLRFYEISETDLPPSNLN